MNEILLHRFEQLVAERTGIRVTDNERKGLREVIGRRMAHLRLGSELDYLRLLELDTHAAGYEWDELAMLITNNESYFFRDKGQMALLRDVLLPELIELRCSRRSLRIWSAGCSTGEEAYSLAIILAELLPRRAEWDLAIIGTDLNAHAVQRARRGIYGAWSFRMVDPAVRDRYFIPQGSQWEIAGAIRSMVSFRVGNLTRDAVPRDPAWVEGFDLIICRNVFIYFEPGAAAATVALFADALADGGYLMTGHGELGSQPPPGLRICRHPESIIYQRATAAERRARRDAPLDAPPLPSPASTSVTPMAIPPVGVPSVVRVQPAPSVSLLPADPPAVERIAGLIDAGDYAGAIELGTRALADGRPGARLLALLGAAHANRGEYEEATRCCDDAVAADPMMIEPYFTLAQIAEERGEKEVAKKLFNDILYLAPGAVGAHLHLADILAGEGDVRRAGLLRREAIGILATLPPGDTVPHYGEATVGEILTYLRRQSAG